MSDRLGAKVRDFIDAGDASGLRVLLLQEPGAVKALVRAGMPPRSVPAVHHVCDRVFEGALSQDVAVALARVLLDAGADPEERMPAHGDSLLISAVSLTATGVAHVLLDRRVDIQITGLFGATALHWAAMLGQPEIVARLIAQGADVNIEDGEYGSTPVGWAIHGWKDAAPGGTRLQPDCARLLIAAGGVIHPASAADDLTGPEHAAMRDALGI
jgi:hypothetical protein